MSKEQAKLLLSSDPGVAKHLLNEKLEYPIFLQLREAAATKFPNIARDAALTARGNSNGRCNE